MSFFCAILSNLKTGRCERYQLRAVSTTSCVTVALSSLYDQLIPPLHPYRGTGPTPSPAFLIFVSTYLTPSSAPPHSPRLTQWTTIRPIAPPTPRSSFVLWFPTSSACRKPGSRSWRAFSPHRNDDNLVFAQ